MRNEQSNIIDSSGATLSTVGDDSLNELIAHGHYFVECRDSDGNLKWSDEIENVVTTLGKNASANVLLDNVAAGAVRIGLKGTGTYVVGDTQTSHSGWLEVGATNAPDYTVGGSAVRAEPTFNAAAAGVKTTAAAQLFVFTSAGTVAGCFINIGGTTAIDNTTGILFSAGDFTLGSKTVTTGDQLSVTYTLTIS